MTLPTFEFASLVRDTLELKHALGEAVASSTHPDVQALQCEVDAIDVSGNGPGTPVLRIALTGQYNAGKSTILRALTGRTDIAIGSDVTTQMATAYDWHGVELLDTPGVRAGYPDHDDETHRALGGADLVVFVVTNELFEDSIGHHFRDLVFTRKRAASMMLVVNKTTADDGDIEIKRSQLAAVTSPYTLDDFRCVFTDALCALEADTAATEEDRTALQQLSNLEELYRALDTFVEDCGLHGRLTAPLLAMRAIADQARGLLSVDSPPERATLELLHRKERLLLESRARLKTALQGVVVRAVRDLSLLGNDVAAHLSVDDTAESAERAHAAAFEAGRARAAEMGGEARKAIEEELAVLERELDSLGSSPLATQFRSGSWSPSSNALVQEHWRAPTSDVPVAGSEAWTARLDTVGRILKTVGTMATRSATGPAVTARAGSVAGARGSDVHVVVKGIGGFFGMKFKPWGAAKVARAIGNVGRVLSALGAVLAVVSQIAEDRREEAAERQLTDGQAKVRAGYRESALAVQNRFWAEFDALGRVFYSEELDAIEAMRSELVGEHQKRDQLTARFAALRLQADDLLFSAPVPLFPEQ